MRHTSGAWIAAGLVVALVALGSLSGCGGGDSEDSSTPVAITEEEPPVTEEEESEVIGEAPPGEDTAQNVVRPGCAEYCQQAGGYGAGETAGTPMVELGSGTVAPLEDGTMPVEVTCSFTDLCSGVLIVNFDDGSGGAGEEIARVDLEVPAGETLTLAVPASPAASQQFGTTGSLDTLLTADVLPSLETLPVEERSEWLALTDGSLTVSSDGAAAP